MRNLISRIGSGLALLLVVSWLLPSLTHVLVEEDYSGTAFTLTSWILVALVAANWRNWRAFRSVSMSESPLVVAPLTEGGVFSIAGALVAFQLWPPNIPLAFLDLTAAAFGEVLFSALTWAGVVVALAYLIAPQPSLAQADHPVQYRDRVNSSKFLLGVAGVVLLYKLIAAFV